MSPTEYRYLPTPILRFVPKTTTIIFLSPHEKSSRFEPKKCDTVRDARLKTQIEPLKDTKLGVPGAKFRSDNSEIQRLLLYLCNPKRYFAG